MEIPGPYSTIPHNRNVPKVLNYIPTVVGTRYLKKRNMVPNSTSRLLQNSSKALNQGTGKRFDSCYIAKSAEVQYCIQFTSEDSLRFTRVVTSQRTAFLQTAS